MRPAVDRPARLRLGLVALVVASVAIVGTAAFLRSRVPASTEGSATAKSVAVLPFTPAGDGGDAEAESLGMALADAVARRLKAARHVQVTSPAILVPSGERRLPNKQLLRALRADAVVLGRIARAQERFDVSVELRRDLQGAAVWTQRYAEQLTDLDAVADAISREIARILALPLSPVQQSLLAVRGTANTEAYQAYLRGWYFWNKRTAAGRVQSIPHFKEAIEKDPAYSVAYAALADAYFFSGQGDRAYPLVAKALAIGGSRPEPYTSSGGIKLFQDWDWAAAEQDFRQAISRDPSYAPAWHWLALALAATGRLDQALSSVEQAVKLEPLSLPIVTDLGWIRYFARQFDAAAAACRQAVDLDAGFTLAHECLYHVYSQQGRSPEAMEVREALLTRAGHRQELAEVRRAFSTGGLREVWKRDIADVNHPLAAKAAAAARLGDREGALARLEEAHRRHEFFLLFVKVDPAFDPVRSDPRFQSVLRGMGLAGGRQAQK